MISYVHNFAVHLSTSTPHFSVGMTCHHEASGEFEDITER